MVPTVTFQVIFSPPTGLPLEVNVAVNFFPAPVGKVKFSSEIVKDVSALACALGLVYRINETVISAKMEM